MFTFELKILRRQSTGRKPWWNFAADRTGGLEIDFRWFCSAQRHKYEIRRWTGWYGFYL